MILEGHLDSLGNFQDRAAIWDGGPDALRRPGPGGLRAGRPLRKVLRPEPAGTACARAGCLPCGCRSRKADERASEAAASRPSRPGPATPRLPPSDCDPRGSRRRAWARPHAGHVTGRAGRRGPRCAGPAGGAGRRGHRRAGAVAGGAPCTWLRRRGGRGGASWAPARRCCGRRRAVCLVAQARRGAGRGVLGSAAQAWWSAWGWWRQKRGLYWPRPQHPRAPLTVIILRQAWRPGTLVTRSPGAAGQPPSHLVERLPQPGCRDPAPEPPSRSILNCLVKKEVGVAVQPPRGRPPLADLPVFRMRKLRHKNMNSLPEVILKSEDPNPASLAVDKYS
ncbi:translation initiation factor IF-2-like [Choloepus didactylus]|uniref:translation initiation factor IF-2-like n=1 Tax=Choloepus didactylus TaxID=27675 RepID=UPI00189F436C|nr:translation initiation factor IF-2-like [Choloepus didactylus]